MYLNASGRVNHMQVWPRRQDVPLSDDPSGGHDECLPRNDVAIFIHASAGGFTVLPFFPKLCTVFPFSHLEMPVLMYPEPRHAS